MSVSLGPIKLSGNTLIRRLEKGVGFALPAIAKNAKYARKIKRLQRLAKLIRLEEPVRIADVGANPLFYDAPYKALLESGLCTVIGFEPQKAAFDKLQAQKGPNESYLNSAVGDGSVRTFYDYKSDGLGSLFPIDQRIEKNITWMKNRSELNARIDIKTVRMDDLEEIGEIDFLKIDIQGGELMVLQNARHSLSKAIATQIEMRFLRIYEGEPCFGEVDCELHAQGFEIHGVDGKLMQMKSPHSQTQALRGNVARQLLDHDFFYIRNLRSLEKLESLQLKKLALLSDGVFNSFDPAFMAIDVLVDRGEVPEDGAEKYRNSLPAEYLA